MKLNYTLLLAFVALLWQLVAQFAPQLPISESVFNAAVVAILIYIAGKLGVEIVELRLRTFLSKRGFKVW